MAHPFRIPLYFIALLLGLSAYRSNNSRYHTLSGVVSPDRARLMAVAMRYKGVAEATGKNDGPQVAKFQAATGNRTGEEWCSSFCAYCWLEAKLPLPRGVNGAARSWHRPEKRIYENGHFLKPGVTGMPMDLVGYVYPKRSPLVHHVGFEISPWGRTANVYTLEGNYGGKVALLMRPKRSIAVVSRHLP